MSTTFKISFLLSALWLSIAGSLLLDAHAFQGEEPTYQDATEGIIAAFEQVSLVAIGENHGHQQLYDFLGTLLKEPALQEAVDDIVVEFGNPFYQDVLDRYMQGEDVPFDSVRLVWRNTIVSPNTVWDSPVYEGFFRTIRAINETLPQEQQYRVLAGDTPVDWDQLKQKEDVFALFTPTRDEHFFQVVRHEVLKKKRKALLLAGGVHMSRSNMVHENKSGLRWAEVSATSLINLFYPGSVFVIGSMGKAKALDHERLATVPVGSLIPVQETWIGVLEANVITNMRNYDGTPFTKYGEARLEDMVDAILYWGKPDAFIKAEPSAQTYQDEAYWQALNRRSLLLRGQPMDESLRQ